MKITNMEIGEEEMKNEVKIRHSGNVEHLIYINKEGHEWWTSPARPTGQWEAVLSGPDGQAIRDAIASFLEAGLSMACLNEALEILLTHMGH